MSEPASSLVAAALYDVAPILDPIVTPDGRVEVRLRDTRPRTVASCRVDAPLCWTVHTVGDDPDIGRQIVVAPHRADPAGIAREVWDSLRLDGWFM